MYSIIYDNVFIINNKSYNRIFFYDGSLDIDILDNKISNLKYTNDSKTVIIKDNVVTIKIHIIMIT